MDVVPFHIGIATDNLTDSVGAVGAALGVSWTAPAGGDLLLHTVDGAPQRRPMSCVSREGPVHVDVMQGEPGTIWAADSPQLHHFGYWTDDLAGDVARLAEQGWRLEMTNADDQGRPTQFAYLIRADGLRLELIDEVGRADYEARLRG